MKGAQQLCVACFHTSLTEEIKEENNFNFEFVHGKCNNCNRVGPVTYVEADAPECEIQEISEIQYKIMKHTINNDMSGNIDFINVISKPRY